MKPLISVIGTVFVDCKGFAHTQYDPEGRNLGDIQFVHGGVGRNVAENLAMMQIHTSFVTTVDRSALGQEVKDRLQSGGIELMHLTEVAEKGMGMWLAMLDENGHLRGSISKMPDLRQFENSLQRDMLSIMESSDHIVLELDLNENISKNVIQQAAQRSIPVYGIPGNMDVILKHTDMLSEMDCFICNEHEAERLLSVDFLTQSIEEKLLSLKQFAKQRKLRRMVITLGAEGSLYADQVIDNSGYQPAQQVKVMDSSGAGDAFFSGTVAALVHGIPLKEAVGWGTQAATYTIQSTENTTKQLAQVVQELVR